MNNYHTHTYRCGHGNTYNDEEEMILQAIKMGMKTLGFSDHLNISGFYPESGGSKEVAADYYCSIMLLKEKYKDKINIIFGYEAEYYPELDEKYRRLLKEGNAEYLVFGNHFRGTLMRWDQYYGRHVEKNEVAKYAQQICQGIESGIFLYVAHPDLYVAGYHRWDEEAIEAAEKICRKAKEYDIPLELNMCGARKGEVEIFNAITQKKELLPGYPYLPFWEIAKKYNNRIVIGYDAHIVDDFTNPINKYIQNIVDALDLKIEKELIIKKWN